MVVPGRMTVAANSVTRTVDRMVSDSELSLADCRVRCALVAWVYATEAEQTACRLLDCLHSMIDPIPDIAPLRQKLLFSHSPHVFWLTGTRQPVSPNTWSAPDPT